ncbi:RING-H2 finger protein ATL44 [Apostasia shenzhenica]|uniref:RING-H2 finger protein ATL44 n=1 Tax=Apostasia shenzhenica TaxID=1088818 RepID=A0A2H9ZTM7_9ASPA|nr:RING-H2 finger protein ATL44 [Apostasia shenzhenica]
MSLRSTPPPLPPPQAATPGSSTRLKSSPDLIIFIILVIVVLLVITLCSSTYKFVRMERLLHQGHPPTPAKATPASAFSAETNTCVTFTGKTRFAGANDCVVCLAEFSDGELVCVLPACSHAFHVECVDRWFSAGHASCPICRRSCPPSVPLPVEP